MPESQREDYDKRKQAMNDALMPFVRPSGSAWLMRDRYETVTKIVNACSSLARRGDEWVPEFFAGQHIGTACGTAWDIHLLTGQPVRFSFNGSTIRIASNA